MIKTEMYAQRIERPKAVGKGKYSTVLQQFMQSDNMTLKILCSNLKEADSCYTCTSAHNKKHNWGLVIWKKNCEVYAIKG